ncbi:MAG TPA: outer membrane protein assembly factor BamE [Luteimonas sp.]|nr:outer membrane protein assembly factor BamE [Luteimonas sp.]
MRKLLFSLCVVPSGVFLAVAMAALISGCGILYKQPIYQGNLIDKTAADQLQAGMSKQQVTTLLGTPSIADPFHHERWDYTASERTGRRGHVAVKNLTLWFEGDALTKWEGEYFPEQDEALSRQMARFGNLPKDKDKKKKGR